MVAELSRREQDALTDSPFERLRELLDGLEPGQTPIDLSLGEPRHPIPSIVREMIASHVDEFGKYPPIKGSQDLREAIAHWLGDRYKGLAGAIDPNRHIIPLNGSREGLFSAIFPALGRRTMDARPAVLMPNPFYQCYAAACLAAGAEPVFLNATEDTHFLPSLDYLDAGVLERCVVMYLCSPSNPQGAIADRDYLEKVLSLARKYDFMLFSDECYSEIYYSAPPESALQISFQLQGSFENVVAFNSLSKRSNLPGIRSGFIAGDPVFLADFLRFRNVACPQIPLPIQHISAFVWQDETHVEKNRDLYAQKIKAADEIIKSRFGYQKPDGAFFLWLNMKDLGGGEAATTTLWKGCGVKLLPGAYLGRKCKQGINPGADYVRVALVHDLDTTIEALERIVEFVG